MCIGEGALRRPGFIRRPLAISWLLCLIFDADLRLVVALSVSGFDIAKTLKFFNLIGHETHSKVLFILDVKKQRRKI